MADNEHATSLSPAFVTHAMESQALSIMKPQLNRIENYPDVAAKLEQHSAETEGQIGRLEEILSSLNDDSSALKDMALLLRHDGRSRPRRRGRRNPQELVR